MGINDNFIQDTPTQSLIHNEQDYKNHNYEIYQCCIY